MKPVWWINKEKCFLFLGTTDKTTAVPLSPSQGRNVNFGGEQKNVFGDLLNIQTHQVVLNVGGQETNNEGEMVESIGFQVL